MMSQRTLLLLSILVLCTMVALVDFWLLPLNETPNRGSELVGALISGGIVAVAVFFLERRYAAQSDKRNLLLTLGTENRFVGIDLRPRDLAGAYLVGKDFTGAHFEGA